MIVLNASLILPETKVCARRSQQEHGSTILRDSGEPNPPLWPTSVKIIRDTDDVSTIKKLIESTQDSWNPDKRTFTCEKHFSSDRHALLFAPGVYKGLDFEIGYYVQLLGLGHSPDHVKFVECSHGPHVPALNKHLHKGGTSLDTFWRSAENFYVESDMLWAVSQAAPLRRVHVGGDLFLHDKGAWSSGGHLANSKIDGIVHSGSQQQFLFRNVDIGGATGGAWSMVYAGCTGHVPSVCPGNETTPSITNIPEPELRMEKPYIALKDDGVRFELRVPRAVYHPDPATIGPLLNGQHEDVRDFERVRVVRATDDSVTQRIQYALDQGKDVVLAAGIFRLDTSLIMRHPDQVLLGIGLATLVAPSDGSPCIRVLPGVPGVRIAGLMLEASERNVAAPKLASPSSLLEWGTKDNNDEGEKGRPGGLFDIFCRVGGAITGDRTRISVDYMIRLHSGNIIGDNLWLWRADHGALAPNEKPNYPHISPVFWQTEKHEFRVETGAEFNGPDIHIFGLAVEHANGHQTVWNGERGYVHFYQCELPYGVGHEFAAKGFRGYQIAPHVQYHVVNAPGIYSNFRNEDVMVSHAIDHPNSPDIVVRNAFTVKLDNQGGIISIANGKGGQAIRKGIPARLETAVNAAYAVI